MLTTPTDLGALSSSALTARLYELRKQERALLIEFLDHLGEVDRRKVYAEAGFSSLFVFLTDYLQFTKASAYRRTTAARLLARFPAIRAYLADGRLCLTTLVELRDLLDADGADVAQILDRASGRTEEQVRELVAALRPRPAPPELIRRVPAPPPSLSTPTPMPAPPPPRPAPPRVEPISEERHLLRMTVGRDFLADLDAVRAALSHQIPDGNLERVLGECLRRVRRDLARRREGAADHPRPPRETDSASSRGVSRAVRRAVWRRDEGCCAYVSPDGRRCRSTFQLQLHHVHPHAAGGPSTVENLALRCSTHNAYHAERDFGVEPIRLAREHRDAQRRGTGPEVSPQIVADSSAIPLKSVRDVRDG